MASLIVRTRSWLLLGRRRDLLAVAVIVGLAICYLAPAFTSGPGFGPADLGRGLSVLTSVANAPVHNNINGDIIDQSVAWNTLNYTLIHHGEFPLWNVYAGNGLPQFLNFESAALSLPSLLGYLVPLSWSFTIAVLVKLLIAGLGTYWCARLLRLFALPSLFAAVSFMLSGAFANWLGWSISGVLCWTGVIVAGAILCLRSRNGAAPVAVLGLSIAFAVYGGFPEGYVLMGASLLALFGVVLAMMRLAGRSIGRRALVRFSAGAGLGVALSAPLWLPGLAVIRSSIRAGASTAQGIPIHGVLLFLAQGYDGLPLHGSAFFLARTNYFESAAYVGVIGLVLVVVAMSTSIFARGRKSPVVTALAIVALMQFLVIYQVGTHDPVQRLVRAVGLGSISTHRLLPVLAFVLALLAGYGLHELMETRDARVRYLGLSLGMALVAIVLVYMWMKVPAASSTSCATSAAGGGAGLAGSLCEAIRRTSLYGPTAMLLGIGLMLLVWFRPGTDGRDAEITGRSDALPRYALVGLVFVTQAGYLLFAGVSINTYSATNYPVTPAVAHLTKITHGALIAQDGANASCPVVYVGPCGLRLPTGIDFYPNINIGYGIDELGMHDPIIPKATFEGWPVANAGQLLPTTNLFNPDVNSVALARAYGVSYVLAPVSTPAPPGMTLVGHLANNGVTLSIFQVPKSAKVTASGNDVVSSIENVGDRRVVVTLVGSSATTVTAHITDSPGWRATISGKRLALERGPTNDLVVRVPAASLRGGRATLTLDYLPRSLVDGAVLMVIALAGFIGFVLVERRTRARSRSEPAAEGAGSW